jgi:hypothetical protein
MSIVCRPAAENADAVAQTTVTNKMAFGLMGASSKMELITPKLTRVIYDLRP